MERIEVRTPDPGMPPTMKLEEESPASAPQTIEFSPLMVALLTGELDQFD